jgi:Lrp/AsnC family leucine-responsive transcriptional regulator
MDDFDKKILAALRNNARLTLTELSGTINLSIPAVHSRLRRLEDEGCFKSFTAILNPDKFGKEWSCFCMVQRNSNTNADDNAFARFVTEQPEILECHRVTGQYEYLLKIVTKSARSMEKLIKKMRENEKVINTYTLTVLNTLKEQYSVDPE